MPKLATMPPPKGGKRPSTSGAAKLTERQRLAFRDLQIQEMNLRLELTLIQKRLLDMNAQRQAIIQKLAALVEKANKAAPAGQHLDANSLTYVPKPPLAPHLKKGPGQ